MKPQKPISLRKLDAESQLRNTRHLFSGLFAAVILILTIEGASAQLILNGDFDSWGTTTGTPPSGIPTSWSSAGNTVPPYQTPGLVAGSTYSAFIRNGGTNNTLSQSLTATGVTNFNFSFTFAALDPNTTTQRSFNLALNQGTSGSNNSFLNLRTVRGSSAGVLSLEAFNGSSWVTLGSNIFSASVYNSGSNTFTTLNAYNVTLSLNLAAVTPTYSIVYGLVGSGTTTLSGLSVFYNAPTGASFYNVALQGGGSSAGYAMDNMLIAAVPEPSTVALLGAGIILVTCLSRNRMRCAGKQQAQI